MKSRSLIFVLVVGFWFVGSWVPEATAQRKYRRQVFRKSVEQLRAPAGLENLSIDLKMDQTSGGCQKLPFPGELELQELSNDEVGEFKDPFGQRVFLPSPNERKFSKIIDSLIQRESTSIDPGYEIMVVREWIKQEDPDLPPTDRRFVILFDAPDLRSNCMISGTLSKNGISEELDFLEVWGWDATAKKFRYYELGQQGWAFAGSSPDLDEPTGLVASNRCLHCHRTGTPLMKELRLPWNNWNSGQSPNAYLDRTSNDSWDGIRNAMANVGDPEDLEKAVKAGIARFNRAQISQSSFFDQGSRKIKNLRFLLKPLFVDRDINFASSRDNSPNSAFLQTPATVSGDVRLPGGLLLAHHLIGNGDSGFTGRGSLGLSVAGQLDQTIAIPAKTYSELVKSKQLGVLIFSDMPSFKSGTDTDFAFFTPVRSYADDHFVGRLLKENILTRDFVAAALLLDVDQPILSNKRKQVYEKIVGLLPNQIGVPDEVLDDPEQHPVTKHLIDSVDLTSLTDGDPLQEFITLLSGDPLQVLEEHWKKRLDVLVAASANPQSESSQKLYADLFESLLARRKAFLADPELRELDETFNGERSAALLPSPPNGN